jgi:hypothetical protein
MHVKKGVRRENVDAKHLLHNVFYTGTAVS